MLIYADILSSRQDTQSFCTENREHGVNEREDSIKDRKFRNGKKEKSRVRTNEEIKGTSEKEGESELANTKQIGIRPR